MIEVCNGNDRAKWLEARRYGIGASESACLLGIEGAWGTPLSVWRSKVEPSPDREDSERLALGKELEATILRLGCERAGVTGWGNRALYTSHVFPFLLATPDGFGHGFCVEVKNVSEWAGRDWDDVPQKYLNQCQHQMLVTGLPRCLFVALVGGNRIVWRWVDADAEWQGRIMIACSELWSRVVRREPPPAVEGDSPAVLADMPRAGELEVDAAGLLETIRHCKAREKELTDALKSAKSHREALEADLAAMLGTHERGRCGQWEFGWHSTERRGYTVEPTTVRQFKIKEVK